MKICCRTLDLTGNHAYNILITAKTDIYFANDQVPAQCKLTQQMDSTTGQGAARHKPYAL